MYKDDRRLIALALLRGVSLVCAFGLVDLAVTLAALAVTMMVDPGAAGEGIFAGWIALLSHDIGGGRWAAALVAIGCAALGVKTAIAIWGIRSPPAGSPIGWVVLGGLGLVGSRLAMLASFAHSRLIADIRGTEALAAHSIATSIAAVVAEWLALPVGLAVLVVALTRVRAAALGAGSAADEAREAR